MLGLLHGTHLHLETGIIVQPTIKQLVSYLIRRRQMHVAWQITVGNQCLGHLHQDVCWVVISLSIGDVGTQSHDVFLKYIVDMWKAVYAGRTWVRSNNNLGMTYF